MHKAVLLTLGRLPKGLEVARCLNAAGCQVYVADPFGIHLSKPSRAVQKSYQVTAPNDDRDAFLSDLEKIIERHDIDLVLPVSEEVAHVVDLHDRLPAGVQLLCPEPQQLLQLHDKLAFIKSAAAAGLKTPQTLRATDAGAHDFSVQHDYVVKPALGCSGSGLRLARKGEPLRAHEISDAMLLQQRINGQEVSTFSLAKDGRVIGSTVYRGLIFAGTVAVCFERLTHMRAVEDWISTFVQHEKFSGFIAFDFIMDSQGTPYPIECNPRLTSGVHFFNHDDLARALLEPDAAGPVGFKPQHRLQEGHTSLTKAYAALPRVFEFLRRLRLVFTTRDVLWSWRDPGPFMLMTPMSWPVIKKAIFQGKSLGQAATQDIELQSK
ncbi:MAG: ATP-grasp domain-containing protein [Pseudomonadota bacterium]